MKKLLYLNYGLIAFLLLLAMIGLYQTVSTYRKYGESYTVTTTIDGEQSSRTTTVWENLFSVFFFLVIVVVVLVDTTYIAEFDKKL